MSDYSHAAFLLTKADWLVSAWAEDDPEPTTESEAKMNSTEKAKHEMFGEDKTTNTKPATTEPQRVYVNDLDAKRFWEKRDQDARNLSEGDLVYNGEVLTMVKHVKRSRGRDGGFTITLDNGHVFDPASDVNDNCLRRITFWRPRRGF